jgi:hypothetical protein
MQLFPVLTTSFHQKLGHAYRRSSKAMINNSPLSPLGKTPRAPGRAPGGWM